VARQHLAQNHDNDLQRILLLFGIGTQIDGGQALNFFFFNPAADFQEIS
jgi:hypothetical protein